MLPIFGVMTPTSQSLTHPVVLDGFDFMCRASRIHKCVMVGNHTSCGWFHHFDWSLKPDVPWLMSDVQKIFSLCRFHLCSGSSTSWILAFNPFLCWTLLQVNHGESPHFVQLILQLSTCSWSISSGLWWAIFPNVLWEPLDLTQADFGSGWESPGTAALWGRKPAGGWDLGWGKALMGSRMPWVPLVSWG